MPRKKATTAAEEKPAKKPARRTVRKTVRRAPRRKTTADELSRAPLPVFESSAPSLAHGHSVHQYGSPHYHHVADRRQRLIVTVGISVIMVVIVTAWILNLNRIISSDMQIPVPAGANQVDFETLKQQLSTSLSEVRGNLGSLGELTNPTATVTPSATPAIIPSSSVTPSTLPSTLPQ